MNNIQADFLAASNAMAVTGRDLTIRISAAQWEAQVTVIRPPQGCRPSMFEADAVNYLQNTMKTGQHHHPSSAGTIAQAAMSIAMHQQLGDHMHGGGLLDIFIVPGPSGTNRAGATLKVGRAFYSGRRPEPPAAPRFQGRRFKFFLNGSGHSIEVDPRPGDNLPALVQALSNDITSGKVGVQLPSDEHITRWIVGSVLASGKHEERHDELMAAAGRQVLRDAPGMFEAFVKGGHIVEMSVMGVGGPHYEITWRLV